MDDTRPDIAEKMRDMLQKKSPIERLKMGCSMYETSKYLIARAIWENTPIYSGADLRKELFLKFYGNDFDAKTKQAILDHLGTSASSAQKPLEQSPAAPSDENQDQFAHIPDSEKEQRWWKYLYPLLLIRLSRGNNEQSTLLKILKSTNGLHTWKDIKNSIEIACKYVQQAERIFIRTSEISNASSPDHVMDEMFAELRIIPYLLIKGFKQIRREEDPHFRAEFEKTVFHIASTYVQGPDFKTQEYAFTSNPIPISSIYKIRPDKLIRLFEEVYAKKKDQWMSQHGMTSNVLLLMMTDLEETYAPWLEHAHIQGVHPLLQLLSNWEIPTVIFGRGSAYEPPPHSLGGAFGRLQAFDWQHFADCYLGLVKEELPQRGMCPEEVY